MTVILHEIWEDRYALGYASEYCFIDIAKAILDKRFCIDKTEDNYRACWRPLRWVAKWQSIGHG